MSREKKNSSADNFTNIFEHQAKEELLNNNGEMKYKIKRCSVDLVRCNFLLKNSSSEVNLCSMT